MSAACRVVLASTVASPFTAELTSTIASLPHPPHIHAFLATSDPAARQYADYTASACSSLGIQFSLHIVDDRDNLEDLVVAANRDAGVGGIIVYYPVWGGRQDMYLQSCVDPAKDIEGLGHGYAYNLYHNIRYLDAPRNEQKSLIPCTPLAVIKTLEHVNVYNTILRYGNRLHGKVCVVINRSEVVGRPLAAMLANDGARVWSVDISGVQEFSRGPGIAHPRHVVKDTTLTLEDVLPLADVVVSAVPSKAFCIPVEKLKDGVVCVNVSSEKNFGDGVAVKSKASIWVPSVGKVTVAMLQRNLVRLCEARAKVVDAEAVDAEAVQQAS